MNEPKKRTNRKFSHEEDQKLKDLVKQYGEHAWEEIALLMNGRNTRQCKDRWVYYLSPRVSNEPWTDEEDEKLIRLTKQLNGKWVQIAKRFKGRNDTQIKNRWNILRKSMNLPKITRKNHVNTNEFVISTEKNQLEKTNSAKEALFDGISRLFSEDCYDLFADTDNQFSFL